MIAGHATRMELYGSLLLVVIVVSLMCERMAIDRVLINTLLKDRSKPAIIHNNQHVIIESENDRIVRQIAKQRGWIEDVKGNGNGNGNADAMGNGSNKPAAGGNEP
jgi:hypothetical protein